MLFFNAEVQSQKEINQSSLIGKKWTHTTLKDIKYYSALQFTDSTQTNTMIVNSKEANSTMRYYLSNTIDTVFQLENVGKNKKGRYIIVEKKTLPATRKSVSGVYISPQARTSSTNSIIYEIIEINNNELKLRILNKKNIITYKSE